MQLCILRLFKCLPSLTSCYDYGFAAYSLWMAILTYYTQVCRVVKQSFLESGQNLVNFQPTTRMYE